MNFASKNRAAMANASGAPPGTFVPPMVFGPPAPTFTPEPYVGPVYTPPARDSAPYVAPEVQWVAGVPNVVTGLTAVAVAYAAYLAVTGEPRKNPSEGYSEMMGLRQRVAKFLRVNGLDTGTHQLLDEYDTDENGRRVLEIGVTGIEDKPRRWIKSNAGHAAAKKADLEFFAVPDGFLVQSRRPFGSLAV